MAFRSHVARSFDPSSPSNRLLFGLVAVALIASAVVVLTDGPTEAWLAPVYLFLSWALVRELDPDHESTAVIAGIGSAVWVLAGFDSSAWLAVAGLMLAGRLLVNTTGRRPLMTDLIGLAAFAVAISFSIVGWVAGFGIALAMYIDDRMAEKHETYAVVLATLAALGSSAVATAARAFPQQVPEAEPGLAIAIGVFALAAVTREPEAPTSLVDSRRKTLLEPQRLHAARSLVAVLIFAAAILSGPDASAVAPMGLSVGLVLISNELERIRRRIQ